MNPTFVEGLLVFFACLWLPTTALSFEWPCFVNLSCSNYNPIRTNGSLLTCSRKCNPSNPMSCYLMESQREPCLNFDTAVLGKCYGGVCYDLDLYKAKADEKAPNKTLPCKHGHDYLYNNRGAFGCQYYCFRSPHEIVNRPDEYPCLRPDTTVKGGCGGGYCKTDKKPGT
ncbi:uncharacterized protein LOC135369282 [Ornithodoros turicata]|uniref:uncharacterized protein LOC135369282 n=1 Tax=Ornithodoros turicata TaxID=34597 RepID=UPI00313A0C16